MILTRIKVKNFLVFSEAEVNFDDSPILVCGHNGAGKSSLFDAVTLALFRCARGTDLKGSGLDNFIKSGESYLRVEVDFIANGQKYTVKLSKDRKKTSIHELYREGTLATTAVSSTTDVIKNLLGIDYETFISSAFLVQGQSGYFFNCKSSTRKQILTDLLGLSEFGRIEQKAIEVRRKIRSKIDHSYGFISSLTAQIVTKQHNLEAMPTLFEVPTEQEISTWADKVKQLTKQVDVLILQSTKAQIEEEGLNKELTELRNRVENSTQNFDETNLESTRKQLEEALNEQITKSVLLENTESQMSSLIREGKETEKHIQNVKGMNGTCPTCLQEVDPKNKEQLVAVLLIQQKYCKDEYIKTKEEKEKLSTQINPLDTAVDRLKNLVKGLELQKASSAGVQQVIQEIAKAIPEKEDKLKTLVNVKKMLTNTLQTVEPKLYEVKKQYEELQKKYNEGSFLLKQKQILQSEIERSTNDLTERKGLLEVLEREQTYYNTLVDAYAPSGIPTIVITKILPLLENYVNYALELLTQGALRLKFLISQDGLDVQITNLTSEQRPYEMCSQGERYRIDLALRYGLTKLLQMRLGTKIETLFIDEGMGSLDEQGKEGFANFLKTISKEFQRILVITHLNDIMELFPKKLQLSKGTVNYIQ